MIRSAYILLGVMAFVWTLVTLGAAVGVDGRDSAGDALAMVAGAVGLALWGTWVFGSFNIELVDGGVVYTFTHPELAFVGIVMAVPNAYVMLTGPIELVSRWREPSQREL